MAHIDNDCPRPKVADVAEQSRVPQEMQAICDWSPGPLSGPWKLLGF